MHCRLNIDNDGDCTDMKVLYVVSVSGIIVVRDRDALRYQSTIRGHCTREVSGFCTELTRLSDKFGFLLISSTSKPLLYEIEIFIPEQTVNCLHTSKERELFFLLLAKKTTVTL